MAPNFGGRLRHWAPLALAYLMGSLLFLWPMPMDLSTAIWGDRFDAWTTLWLIGHLAERLETGNFSAMTTDILYPIGYNLWSFGHLALQGLGAILVWAGIGTVAAYNCLLIGGVWTSALAAHLLGKEVTGSHVAGGVAGVVFGSSPYLYAEGAAGCIELVFAGLIPLHAWSLVRLARRPTWGRCIVATLALAIIGPFNWYYTLFSGVFGIGFCALRMISMGTRIGATSRAPHRSAIALILLSMVLAAVISLPLIDAARQETPTRPPLDAELFSDPDTWVRTQEISNGSAPIKDLSMARLEELDAMQVILNSTSVLHLIDGRFSVNPLGITPGLLAYVIAFFGLMLGGRRTWTWAALAVGFTVLTLGPFLTLEPSPGLAPDEHHSALPYAWLYMGVPFFSKAYRPYRFAVVVLQCLAVMGAIGTSVLVHRLGSRRVAAGAILLGMIGFSQPLWSGDKPAHRRTMNAQPDPMYLELREAPEGAVIELPLQYQPVSIATARQQTFQLAHGHPLLNTNQLIRRPDLMAFRDLIVANSMLLACIDFARAKPPITIYDDDIARLSEQGFRYLVVHDRIPADQEHLAGDSEWADMVIEPGRTILESIMGAPVIQTPEGRVYDLARATLQPERSRTWTGSNVTDLDLSFDAILTGFPLILRPGTEVELTQAPARRISLWARPQGDAPGSLRLEIRGESSTTIAEVRLEAQQWAYTVVDLAEAELVQIALVAGVEGASVGLTRVQVVR